jgi:DNA/RNA-binding domain of Phe-tRNA-synthetase-like protein
VSGPERDRQPLGPAPGFVAADVSAEFPGLRLDWLTVQARRRPSPPALRRRLVELSNRYRGASVVAMRTQPIPHAFRAFFRQIGLDPDVDRVPSESAAVARLLQGGFRSFDLIADACLVALIETGVPVWALDADVVDEGGLGIVSAAPGAELEGLPWGRNPAQGSLLVADGSSAHAVLFGEPAPGHGVNASTRRVALFSVGVEGVPAIHVEEALWLSTELLGSEHPGC